MAYGKPEYDPIADAHRCDECGKWFRALARHITRHHMITTREYKAKWGIDMKESLIGNTVREKLQRAVYDKGTFKNLESGRATRFKPGNQESQSYRRSEQTKRRLRVLRKKYKSKLKRSKVS